MEDVCGVILAGSHHWGDGQFERMLRGPLVPVAQKPVIRYALSWLQGAGVRYGVICANGATASVRGALGDGSAFGLALDYVEDVEPRGPAGCVHDAARHSHASIFVVVEGCMIPSLDLRALIAAHRLSGAAATVVVEVERRRRMVGSQAHSPGGIYVFDRRVLESVPARGYHDIKEGLVERLYKAGERVLMHEVQGVAPRVLDFATYASVNQWMISRTVERPGMMSGYVRSGTALLHPTAEVHPSARFIGPVIVGPGVSVEADVVVIGPASIGARSRIGAGATLSRSIVWDDCVIAGRAIVDASLLANASMVAADEQVFGHVQVAPVRRARQSQIARLVGGPARHSARVATVVTDDQRPVAVPKGFDFLDRGAWMRDRARTQPPAP